jgi:hypothetical protein
MRPEGVYIYIYGLVIGNFTMQSMVQLLFIAFWGSYKVDLVVGMEELSNGVIYLTNETI